jgi:hypothetical protein
LRHVKLSTGNWDEPRQAALIAQIMNAELSLSAACERHELSPDTVRRWVPIFRLRTLQALDDKLQQTSLIESVNADGLGNAMYSGSVEDIPVSDLMQTCQMGGKDAVITVTCGKERSSIWCSKGVVVDAESGRLRGEAAVYRILDLDHGQVSVDFHCEPRERTIELPCSVLLLESARHKDECSRLLTELDGSLSIYSAAPGARGADTTLTDREVLDLCNGTRSVGDVLAASERSDLETLGTFVSLVQRGYLVRHGISRPPPPSEGRSPLEDWASGKTLQLSFEQVGRPHSRTRSWLPWLVGPALVLAALAWWNAAALGSRGSAVAAASTNTASLTFLVEVSTQPPMAEVWLDGVRVGTGTMRRSLLRDGQLHRLEVFAPGYVPTTVVLSDRSVHYRIALEPLSAASPRSVVTAAPADVASGAVSPPAR